MSKLKSGTKYAILGDNYKLAVPVALLDKILQEGLMVDHSWDTDYSTEIIKSVHPIESCKFVDGVEIDHIIAEAKLSGDK